MYQVVQRNPNSWYESGECEIMSTELIGGQTTTDDLHLATIACDARNALDCKCNGQPMYRVESDYDGEHERGDTGPGMRPVDASLLGCESSDVHDYLVDVLGVDPEVAARAIA